MNLRVHGRTIAEPLTIEGNFVTGCRCELGDVGFIRLKTDADGDPIGEVEETPPIVVLHPRHDYSTTAGGRRPIWLPDGIELTRTETMLKVDALNGSWVWLLYPAVHAQLTKITGWKVGAWPD